MILPLTLEVINPKPTDVIKKGDTLIFKVTNPNANMKKELWLGELEIINLIMVTAVGLEEVQITIKNIEPQSVNPLSSLYFDSVFDSEYPLNLDFATTSLLISGGNN